MKRTWAYLAGGGALLLAGITVTQLADHRGTTGGPTLAAPTSTLPARVAEAPATQVAAIGAEGAARLAAAEAEIDRLTEALAAATAENTELHRTLALRDTVLDTLKASVAERDAALADLRDRLASNEAELASLNGRLDGLKAPADFDHALASLKLDAGGPSVARIEPAAVSSGDAGFAPGAPVRESGSAVVEVQFDFASSALTPGGQERAAVAAATLSGMALAEVRVVGHTDRVGRPEANRRLAARRADAVARFLVEAGLPADIIVIDGAGEAGAPITTDDGVAEPLNRSVLIFAQARPTS
ncbi:outer membrane protein OmpA-like peptidoglycan-associated protein [Amaricoccus macauensis]|uniref:Outer membrane protein OmpA-like peptidoglycan-associated protein n=1 Tax=Amaricoccus macauensis TaxID=57001 RepID=A0A840SKZ3_9RHOB|nr:OmpA family protein [Amaricoccus macauensis]MBB5220556.1 outer membrane protein OmpA-like peptidoglycan-associated protein [Amaricoccus macauensis]